MSESPPDQPSSADREDGPDRAPAAEPAVAASVDVPTGPGHDPISPGHDPTSPGHDPTSPGHDPTGLDLARSIADSVGAQQRRWRRRRPGRPPPTDPVRSGAAPDDRDPKPLGSALDHLVEAKGWRTDLSVRTLLARWPILVGPTNAAHSWPESYADTVLTVRTESTVWATSLRTIAPQLVAKLNDQLGDGTVSRVKVLGPQGPSWKKGPLSVRDGRGPRDTYG